MRDYLISMIVISVICFVAKELSAKTALAGHIGLVCGLCIFLVSLGPFLAFMSDMGSFELESIYTEEADKEKYEEIFDSYIKDAEVDLIKAQVRQMVAKEFSLDESEIKIYLKYDAQSENKLERISVRLLGNAVFADSNKIKSFVENKTGVGTVVIIGE